MIQIIKPPLVTPNNFFFQNVFIDWSDPEMSLALLPRWWKAKEKRLQRLWKNLD